MTFYYEELDRSRRRAFAAGALAGGLVIALIVGTLWATGSFSSERRPPERTVEQIYVPSTPTPTPPSRLERCAEVFAAQTRLLETLARPLSQWRRQIGVMNKLVTGVMTPPQGLRFWDQNHQEVLAALSRYKSARVVFDERTVRCPGPREGRATPFERRCSEAVARRDTELSAADVALDSWQRHVSDFEELRGGETTLDQVSQPWLTSWREYVGELTAYRAAARAAAGQTC